MNTGAARAALCDGLSRMSGNVPVRFLGEGAAVTPCPYPTQLVRHRMIENRGAFSEITDHGVEKREQEEFLSKRLCFLTCLLMGDPLFRSL